MKRILSIILLCATALCAHSQEDVTLFFLNDGSFKGFYDEEIDSITYSHLDLDSVWHDDAVVQDVWLADSVVRIPIEKIDSICHKVPDPVYRPDIVKIDERYLPYIQSVDGLTITFSSSLPKDLQPHKNDVLIYEGSSDFFPEGFAGKVVTEGTKIVCEEVGIQDVYDKFVLFGNYILVNKNNDSESPSYRLQRIKSTKYVEDAGGGGGGGSWGDDEEDYGIDNWRFGYKELNDINIGTIKKPIKIDLKKIHTSINIDYEITPVISIELAWDLYTLSNTWGLYYKRNLKANYKNKYYVKYSRDTKPEKDSEKTLWNSFWKGYEPDWIEAPDKEGDDKDDDDTQSLYIFNKEVPIPECPLFKLGLKFGMFIQPKLEGELRAGWETSGNIDRTYIYRLDRGNLNKRGDSMDCKGPEDSETTMILDGSVKGSLWLGAIAGIRLNFGLGQGNRIEGVTEEANFRFGPYAEFELKADFSEAMKNRSMYSLVQDSKCKRGWKLGVDAIFTAKIAGIIDFKWTEFSWSPKKMINEHSLYFYPKFDPPKYSINGNSLRCWTNVNRVTFPNTIGYVLLKEDGTEAGRKYLDESYSFLNDDVKYADVNNPFQLVLTFDNLDFVNHRYTIVPTTRLFGWELFGLDVPEEQRTVVLCPNSNHPHLIDMGLPSGTKWLCQNVYADAPEDAGGYYQWGNPYKSHVYNELTYRAPAITTANYQGTRYDAATVNLGDAYSTPTLKQFKELLDNCTSSLRYSTWGDITGSTKGLYLKGRNGGNLYLPFSGFMKDTKIFNESKNDGFYLLSDALDSNNEPIRKAINVTENLVVADAKANGYSVRPVGSDNTGQVSFSHQEVVWEGVYTGQESGQTIVVTNNGSSPVSVTVAQAGVPFKVDDACLGTFTVKPKEQLNVLVFFSPTEEKEYSSVLTLSYETGNTCVVSKFPLKGKGIKESDPKFETITVKGVSFNMVAVEGGTFMMGATAEQEDGAEGDEYPVHQVTLSSFAIGQTEVTQALWEAVMGSNPSYFPGNPNRPVEEVSWDDCQTFISKLNSLTGRNFRLPTEAEWEYAARGGNKSKGYKYSGSNDLNSVAWYYDNSGDTTHDVATKQANELGIYDMSGNVFEWCNDWYGSYSSDNQSNPQGPSSGSFRVRRGGCFYYYASFCRSASRCSYATDDRGSCLIGLRLVLSGGDTPSPDKDGVAVEMSRKYLVNTDNSVNNGYSSVRYSYQGTGFNLDNGVSIGIDYHNGYYWTNWDDYHLGVFVRVVKDNVTEEWYINPLIKNEWVDEKIIINYDGTIQYFMNNEDMGTHHFDLLKIDDAATMTLDFSPYGWWYTHYHYMDDFKITTQADSFSDNFDDGVMDTSFWLSPTNPDGVKEEEGIMKMIQLRTDQDFHLKTREIKLDKGSGGAETEQTGKIEPGTGEGGSDSGTGSGGGRDRD